MRRHLPPPPALAVALLLAAPAALAAEPVLGAVPIMPLTDLALPTGDISAATRPDDGFTGSVQLSAEVVGLYRIGIGAGSSDGLAIRPCATVRLGPLVLCAGALITGDATRWNIHGELVSYQRDGWELGLGLGLRDGATVRVAVPLTARWLPIHTQAVRVRAMYAIGSAHSVGVGLEADVW